MKSEILLSALSSLFSAVTTSVILHPFDVVKTRQQVSATSKGAVVAFPSFVLSVRHIIRTEGLLGLYEGIAGQVVASGVSWFIFRYLFDFVRYNLEKVNQKKTEKVITGLNKEIFRISPKTNSIATIIASVISTLFVHPLWLIKTRLETQSPESREKGWKHYSSGVNGFLECLNSIYREEGISGLYSGIYISLLLIPHSVVQLVTYDFLKNRYIFISEKDSVQRSLYYFMLGFSAKFLAALITYPLQVIRTRIQISRLESIPLDSKPIEMNIHNYTLLVYILRDHIYPGITTHIPKVCLHSGIMFLIHETLLKLIVGY
ncbi:mitochondrial carrier [Cryptosporidium bovis]|uniref:mitochondrial carrier n=1 Tax=Cryptosporidium bovis TaxID=310047 RepID=UPI00351A33C1|nr:mitochondrial carrier [Cryptosporidium bovis]